MLTCILGYLDGTMRFSRKCYTTMIILFRYTHCSMKIYNWYRTLWCPKWCRNMCSKIYNISRLSKFHSEKSNICHPCNNCISMYVTWQPDYWQWRIFVLNSFSHNPFPSLPNPLSLSLFPHPLSSPSNSLSRLPSRFSLTPPSSSCTLRITWTFLVLCFLRTSPSLP